MRRGTLPLAAGRSTPGKSPLLAPTYPPSTQFAAPHIKAGQRSALTGQTFSSRCPISNRNFRQLENAATSTKQTADPSSNRNFRSTDFHRIRERSLPKTIFSNRYWIRLEIAVTHRKQSPVVRSNRYKITLKTHTPILQFPIPNCLWIKTKPTWQPAYLEPCRSAP